MNDVTLVLDAIQQGDLSAAEKLLPLVYQELRRIAASKMAKESPGHTLQPTALVHEAWLRLVDKDGQAQFQNRGHFFSAAAEAMRRILVENARRKSRQKRGGDFERVDFEEAEIAAACGDDELIAISEALDKLAGQKKQHVELVKLRFFVGMTINEAAEVMGISVPTADRYWAYAKAWLQNEIQNQ